MERHSIRGKFPFDFVNLGLGQIFLFCFTFGALAILCVRLLLTLETTLILGCLACLLISFRSIGTAIAILLASLWMLWSIESQLNSRLPVELDRVNVLVPVTLAELPEVSQYPAPNRYTFRLLSDIPLDGFELQKGSTLRLSDYQRLDIAPRERWQLRVVLRAPRSTVNPAGFDYAKWLLTRDIAATGYIRKSDENKRLGTTSSVLISVRHVVHDKLNKDSPINPLMMALIMGDKRGLSSNHFDTLQALGISHLFVISGLHIGLMAMFGWLLGSVAMRLVWFPMLHANGLWVPTLFSLGLASCYAVLAGLSLPTQRALVMITVALGCRVLRREYQVWDSLFIAAFFVIVISPMALLSVSFWLSFVATGCLLSVIHSSRPWLTFLKTQLVLFIVLGSTASLFGLPTAWFGPVVNAVLIPLVSLVVLPLVLFSAVLAMMDLSQMLLFISSLFDASWVWVLASDLADAPTFFWPLPISIFIVALLLAWRRTVPAKIVVLGLVCSVFWNIRSSYGQPLFRVTVFDVGQGLSVFIEQGEYTLLYDTGAAYKSGFSLAESVVIPSIKYFGHHHLTHFVVSHDDNDHAGGADYIKSQLVPAHRWASEVDASSQFCMQGLTFEFGEAKAKFLTPVPLDHADENDNNRSCVLYIDFNGFRVLLTGDIEKKVERILVEQIIEPVDVLIVPHHGSKTSTSSELLDWATPRLGLVSAGFNNRFKHPHWSVVQRLEGKKIKMLNTANTGAITIELYDGEPQVTQWRTRQMGFWH